ncbi:AP-1 complex subunit sigma-1 [Termitomyces sp. J132]|nr:AP-1 complex subunit sigma-1 [Termitomyces sp. J132]
MCNVIEYKGTSYVVYRQYASLFFICEIGEQDNELLTLEIIHRYVEILDKYFGNVSLQLTRESYYIIISPP